MQRLGSELFNLSYIRSLKFNSTTIAFIHHGIYCFLIYDIRDTWCCKYFLFSFVSLFPSRSVVILYSGSPYSPKPQLSYKSFTSFSLHV